MTRWDVLGLGVITVDDLLYVDGFPAPDSKQEIRGESRQGGGLTATALVAAARNGARAAFLGVLGDDELSCFAIASLEREGIDCSPVVRSAGARPVHSRIIVETGSGRRTILYTREGATYPPVDEVETALSQGARILLVDPLPGDAVVHAVNCAQAAGIAVVADVENIAPTAAQFLIERADHLIMGVEAGRRATGLRAPGDIAAALGGPQRACSAITAGEEGSWFSERGGLVEHIPALKVDPVDTTGCGDVFHGAYAAALARGDTVRCAIRVATVAAGLKATQPGGRAGIPDRATTERVLLESGLQ